MPDVERAKERELILKAIRCVHARVPSQLKQFFFKSGAAQSLGCGGPCCAAPCSRVRGRWVVAAVCDGWSGTCGASGVALLPCAGSSAVRHRRRTRRCTTKRLVRRACDGAHACHPRWFGFFRRRMLRWNLQRRRRGTRIPRPARMRSNHQAAKCGARR
jgi:hypothetical protein